MYNKTLTNRQKICKNRSLQFRAARHIRQCVFNVVVSVGSYVTYNTFVRFAC